MSLVCAYKCIDVVFDIYNTEDVERASDCKYYVTPKLSAKIEKWMIENNVDKIQTKEHLDYLIHNGYFGVYPTRPQVRIVS